MQETGKTTERSEGDNAAARGSAAGDPHELPAPAPDAPPALQRLGAAPFAKGRFPFLGFLASVYDHVAAHARGRVK